MAQNGQDPEDSARDVGLKSKAARYCGICPDRIRRWRLLHSRQGGFGTEPDMFREEDLFSSIAR